MSCFYPQSKSKGNVSVRGIYLRIISQVSSSRASKRRFSSACAASEVQTSKVVSKKSHKLNTTQANVNTNKFHQEIATES
jgi:hypothetical protein